ncbi:MULTISPECIES: WD40/YVTN/BNR-like repeat-containing protein [Aurantimonadaceae]|uniref:YCF48-related protein n=1 Tax=Jiella pelagia TaxID=2986949 RepID=A0ABY7C5X6_9HYPH|nr:MULTISPECIES: YCF48-related protein [Aurantimonadaceae]WAP71418.1 YCF48-related protein [Jiella pelagia]
MPETNIPSRKAAWLPRLALAAVMPALIAGHGAAAQEAELAPTPIEAMAYDAGSKALLVGGQNGLFRSTDEGQTWQTVPLPPGAGEIAATAVPARSDNAIYVAGPDMGVLRTDDRGESWSNLNSGLPNPHVTALAAHSTQPDTVYAYVPETGIYRSQDAGKSWKMMDRGPEGTSHLIHTNMEGSMESGWLYAATPDGTRVSMDCFCLWRDAGNLSGPITGLAFDPQHPKHLYAASDAGLFKSTDGGQEWIKVSSPPIAAAVTSLMMAPTGVLYAGADEGEIFKSSDGAATWERAGE